MRSSKTKRALIKLLKEKPLSLSDIARKLEMTPASVFQHGKELAELGLVTKDKLGGRAYLVLTNFGRELLEGSAD